MAAIPKEKKVSYNFVGSSGLRVSNLCLGTMTFGKSFINPPTQTDEELAHQIMDRFVEWGGNFIDTADVYGPYFSEQIVGRWLEKRQRDNFVVATKVRFPIGVGKNRNSVGLSRRHITASIMGSLERLRTNYVDIYQTHVWDVGANVEETLRTLDDLVRAEKVRYVGVSNVTGWQMQKLVDTTQRLGLNPISSLQQQYSLVSRESEVEAFQVCKASGIGVLPWSPLKGGVLTGKLKRGVKPTEGRLGYVADNSNRFQGRGGDAYARWDSFDSKIFDIVETTEAIAKRRGKSMPQVAIRWLLQKDVTTSVIIGATSTRQLDDNMGTNGWSLTKEDMDELDKVSLLYKPYPYSMVDDMNNLRANPSNGDHYVRSKI